MQKVNEFYPVSKTMSHNGMWEMGMALKINEHLKKAKGGDRGAESKLCNRVGQLRRNTANVSSLIGPLQDSIKESVAWLRGTGRTLDLSSDDPRKWISTRNGCPRF